MRKINRMMMATVSILLSLVLVTSSVVSGTLAKYVTRGEAESSAARVAKWGVEVSASLDDDFLRYLDEETTVDITTVGDGTLLINVPQFTMHPGDVFSDAIHFEISGTPEVAVKLNIEMVFSTNVDAYFVPVGVGGLKAGEGLLGKNDTGLKIFPMGLTFCADDDVRYVIKPWSSEKERGLNNYIFSSEKTVMAEATREIAGMTDLTYTKIGTTAPHYTVHKEFAPNQSMSITYTDTDGNEVNINSFAVGFEWPLEYERTITTQGVTHKLTKEQINEMEMYICNNKDNYSTNKITLQYIVSITQID